MGVPLSWTVPVVSGVAASGVLGVCLSPAGPNATLQARGIAGARDERTLFPVALQALVRCFSRADEEICWDAQVLSQLLNLWE